MKKLFFAILIAPWMVLSSGQAQNTRPGYADLGGIDVLKYCRGKHSGQTFLNYRDTEWSLRNSVSVNPDDLYSWKCMVAGVLPPYKQWPTTVDMDDACYWIYGSGYERLRSAIRAYTPEFLGIKDSAYRWRCEIKLGSD